jgi:hypothetical protein
MRQSLCLLSAVLMLTLIAPSVGVAQEATSTPIPEVECVAPELPPGTVTPPQEAPSEAAPSEVAPEPTPIPEGVPADQATIDRYIAAEQNIFACFNTKNYLGSAALFSAHGLEFFFGSPNPYDAAAALEGYPPLKLLAVDNVEVLPDGRIRGELTYTVGWQLTGGVEYWVEEDGMLKLDAFTELPAPLEPPAGAAIVELEMIDYAFVLTEYTVPATEAIAFRTSSRSASGSDHVAILVGCPEGITTEQLVLGEVDWVAACTDLYGQQYLRPRDTGYHDMIFIGLPPGTYYFICDVPTATGTSHHRLGMVAQITIE